MKCGIGLFLFMLVLTTALAASKCGKKSYKSKYGTEKSFRSVSGIKSKCKYRIKTIPGLHIKLALENYRPDPGNLEISISAIQNGGEIEEIEIPSGPHATVVVNASSITLLVKTSSAVAQPVVVNHEAVVPADGNFGYNLRATRKPTAIRSLNFPKTKLPSGVRSVWNVTSGRGQIIRIDITGLSTADGEDTLQILDGSTSIAILSGTKKKRQLPVTKYASSGNMVIKLETQTDRSKGFKAKIVAMERDGEHSESSSNESSENLQCHKRLRVISGGTTISDEHTQMTCDEREICGTMIVEGSSTQRGINLPIRSETMHCIPRSLCSNGGCGGISSRRDKSIRVDNCNLTCCDTNLCNGSPDGPPTSSGSSARPPVWPLPGHNVGLRCDEQSEITRASGVGMGSASSGSICPPSSVCALYVFSGVSDDTIREKVVGYVAKCTPEANCNEAGCSALSETRDVNVGSCNVTCCREDNCNDHSRATVPTLPPPEPVAHNCYDVRGLRIRSSTQITDVKLHQACSDTEDRCVRVDAYVTNRDGQPGVASFGKCISKSACNDLDCESLLGVEDSISVTSCIARCCSNDLCNEMPLNIPHPTVETTGLWCHRQSATVQEGAVLQSPDQNSLCDEGDVCAVFKFFGTSTESHQIGEPMSGYAAMCRPAATCNEDACSTLSETDDIAVTSCEATCCSTSMCNDPGEPPMPSPRPPRPGFVNRCYNIQQTRLPTGTHASNIKSEASCDADSVCARGEATVMVYGLDASIVYGSCVPKVACASLNCDAVTGALPRGTTARDCKIQCCETDLCNGDPIPAETSTPSSTAVSHGATLTGTVSQCYSILQAVLGESSILNQKSTRNCDPESVCVRLDATVTRPGFDQTMSVTYGACYPKVACGATGASCDLVTRSIPGVKIHKCRAQCCATDLCNENPLPESSIPAASPTPSIAGPGSARSSGGDGEAQETTRCYNIFKIKSYGITLPGEKKDVMPCAPGSQCIKILAVSSNPEYPGITAETTIGYCLPRAVCASMDCSALPQVPGMTERTCSTECCDGDLCNG